MKRVVAVVAALTLSLAAGTFAMLRGGVAQLPSACLRSAYPTYGEVASWSFMASEYDALRDAGKAPQLILGSSELKSRPAGPAHPGRLFADGRYGATSVIAGRAGVNDLWQAIEVGAYAPHMPQDSRRAVIFVSMQWFMCYRDPQTSFPDVFSQGAYDAFMANRQISADVKHRVADRVRAYGVADAESRAQGPLDGMVDGIDRSASSLASDLRLAMALRVREAGPGVGVDGCEGDAWGAIGSTGTAGPQRGSRSFDCTSGGLEAPCAGVARARGRAGSEVPAVNSSRLQAPSSICKDSSVYASRALAKQEVPDWDALISEGERRASRASASNADGYYDSWYREKYPQWLAGARKNWKVDDGEYWSAQEFEDFKLMLEVCRQTGVEPLVVIQPVKGAAYDQTIYTREVRAAYYDMIRSACSNAGVRVADFSDREYDRLFLRDYSHPSAYGSAVYSQAIYYFWIS